MAQTHPVEQHSEQLVGLRRDVDDHEERLRVVERSSAEHGEQLKTLFVTVGRIEQISSDIREAVEELKAKPGHRWDSLVGYLLAAVAALIVGRLIP